MQLVELTVCTSRSIVAIGDLAVRLRIIMNCFSLFCRLCSGATAPHLQMTSTRSSDQVSLACFGVPMPNHLCGTRAFHLEYQVHRAQLVCT